MRGWRFAGLGSVVAAALLAGHAAGLAQQAQSMARMPLEIFGLRLGAGPDAVRKLTTDRGYKKFANGFTRVPTDGFNYIERIGQIEDYTQTRYLTQIAAIKTMGKNHTESFRFFFLAPPNDNVSFGGGIAQFFGGNAGPMSASPLTTEVKRAFATKYGQPGYANEQTGQYGWFEGASGGALTGAAAQQCLIATVQAVGADPYAVTGTANATVSNTQAIARAMKVGCVAAFVADVGERGGYVTSLMTRVIDFRMAAAGAARTGQLYMKLKAGADADRAKRNRPDF